MSHIFYQQYENTSKHFHLVDVTCSTPKSQPMHNLPRSCFEATGQHTDLSPDPKIKSYHCSIGSEETALSDADIKREIESFLSAMGHRDDVLILPPDFTRFHSQSGKLTRLVAEYYNFVEVLSPPLNAVPAPEISQTTVPKIEIMPALGTHAPMTKDQIRKMFGEKLADKDPFLVHDWRNDVVTIGEVPAELVSRATYNMVNRPWPAQLNKRVWEKRMSQNERNPLVLSIGQVVPHEVMGMANFNKNVFVGVGGVEAINLSHFIGAVHGMEKMMGRADNPLRAILNYASEKYLQNELDLWYILTVMGTNDEGELQMRGLYIGNDIDCYTQACALSLKVNFTLLQRAPKKVVVFLDGDEFHSTWLGNKAIYRTRMAIADGGELIILAPGVKRFGEDDTVDILIRKYGYIGTPQIMKAMEENEELKENLSAVAHLIHGSSEGRFTVTYCPGYLTKEEVEGVGFLYSDLGEMQKIYNVDELKEGWNQGNGDTNNEEFFFVSNPALGLWAIENRFEEGDQGNIKYVPTDVSGSFVDKNQKAVGESGGVGGWKKSPTLP